MGLAGRHQANDNFPRTPGEYLRREMAVRGLTAQVLAEHIDVHPQTIYNVTTGKRLISSRLALKLTKIFRRPVDFWLLDVIPPSAFEGSPYADLDDSAVGSLIEGGPAQDVYGLLIDRHLRSRLSDPHSGISIVPWSERQIQATSYDLTIGLVVTKGLTMIGRDDWGLIVKYHWSEEALSDDQVGEALRLLEEYGDDIAFHVDFAEPFTLPRGGSVGIVSREELDFSGDYMADVGGTTENAMAGLIVNHGIQVDPGYCGPIIVTAMNMGLGPIVLRPPAKLVSLAIRRLPEAPDKPYEASIRHRFERIASHVLEAFADLFDYEEIAREGLRKAKLRAEIDKVFVEKMSLEELRGVAARWVVSEISGGKGARPRSPLDRLAEAAIGRVTVDRADVKALVRRFPIEDRRYQEAALSHLEEEGARQTLGDTIARLGLDAVQGILIIVQS